MKKTNRNFLSYLESQGISNKNISLEDLEILDRLTNVGPANEGDYPLEALENLSEQGFISEVYSPLAGYQTAVTQAGADYFRDNNIETRNSFEESELDDPTHVDDSYRSKTEGPEADVAMEAIMPISQRGVSFGTNVLLKVAGLMMAIPKATFDREDVDPKVVEKLLKYPDLLDVIASWIDSPQQELLPDLIKAHKVLSPLIPRSKAKKLYRGFKLQGTGQQALGLQVKGFFKKKPSNFQIGSQMEYVTDKAVSFSEFESTATVFGNAVVSIDYNRYARRLLNIDPNISFAIEYKSYPEEAKQRKFFLYYGEMVLLPSPEPIVFTIEAFGKQKVKQ